MKIVFLIIGIISIICVFSSVKWYFNELQYAKKSMYGAEPSNKPLISAIKNFVYTILAFLGFFSVKSGKKKAGNIEMILGVTLIFSAIGFIPGIILCIIS